ncbi:MAG: SURF1 family protein [Oceanicaulis sp.]|nr:SURF1 family protein [Oceanicaulis sp.]
MIIFRPYPVLTLLTVMALAFLLALGGWQLERQSWKQGLLDAHAVISSSPPAPLDALCDDPAFGQPIAGAQPDTEIAVRVFGRSAGGAPGWRLFAPAPLPECAEAGFILTEAGFEPLSAATAATEAATAPGVQAARAGLRLETPLRRGLFGAADSPDSAEFYAFDAATMEAALDLAPGSLLTGWWLAVDDGAPPAWITATPPERHGAYALTWYLMAVALAGVWIALNVTRGRIGWRPKR